MIIGVSYRFQSQFGRSDVRTSPPVQVEGKMHTDCWIQQVNARVGVVTCWNQQYVSPKQVVGFTCVFNSEIDQLVRKLIVIGVQA